MFLAWRGRSSSGVDNGCRQRTGGRNDTAGPRRASPGTCRSVCLMDCSYGRSVRNLPTRFPSGGMKGMTKPDTPFPKHWLYYIVLKYVVIAAAVLIAIYVASQLL